MKFSFRRQLIFTILINCVVIFSADKSFSAAPGEDFSRIRRQQEQILQQQEERLRQQEQFFQRNAPAVPDVETRRFENEPEQPGAPCVEVSAICVEGATLLSSSQINAITEKHIGKCLALPDINNILRDITNVYIDRGYVTARAFVKPDAGKPNTLTILVVEGEVEKILLNKGEPDYYYRGRTAFPWLEGRPLNLRDIEQGIDQLNRLPSQDASMELEPGEKLGGTVVQVNIPPARSWRVGGGTDNLGQRTTGQWQYNLFFEKDNLLGLGDQFAAYWTEDAPFLEKIGANRDNMGHSHSFSSFASIPWGYWNFSASLSRFDYETKIYGLNKSYLSIGHTATHSVQAERVIHRDGQSKTSLGLALTNRDVKNYIENDRLEASSYILTTLSPTISHNRHFLGGSLGTSLGYTSGLPILGTKRQEDYEYSAPKSSFHKFSGDIRWTRPFSLAGESFYYSLAASGQLTGQTLRGVERISLGSRYTVRGFHEQSASGDQGGYVRNEVSWDLPWFANWRNVLSLQGVQLYTAYDYGAIIKDNHDPYERGHLTGASLGLRSYGAVAFDLTVSKPLLAPDYIQKRDLEVYMSLRCTF